MSIEGNWRLTQSIDGQTFHVEFGPDHRVGVNAKGVSFVGAWASSSDEVTFTLANANSATVYQGTFLKDDIGRNNMSGTSLSVVAGASTAAPGTWSATLE